MPKEIPTIIRSIFTPEMPSLRRIGYPLVPNKMKELRARYGKTSNWSTLPVEDQLKLFRELCAHYEALVFHDKYQCYRYFAHEKTYRTGFHLMMSLKTFAKKNPDANPRDVLRRRCIPVCAPAAPAVDDQRCIDHMLSDGVYRMIQMDQLTDTFDRALGRSKYSRLFFPEVPVSRERLERTQRHQRLALEAEIDPHAEAAEEQELLEESSMELLKVSAQRRDIAMPKAAPQPIAVSSRPPTTLAAKAEVFFRPAEIVVTPQRRARFVEKANRPDGLNDGAKKPSELDKSMAGPVKEEKARTARIPEGFLKLAKRFRFKTWTTEGIYYPRRSYTFLPMFLFRKIPPPPLAPGAIVKDGVVLIPWDLHHRAMDGDNSAVQDIIWRTALQ